jgi:hypothetical protein
MTAIDLPSLVIGIALGFTVAIGVVVWEMAK